MRSLGLIAGAGFHVCALCSPLLQSDWNIVQRGWEAHVLGKAPHQFTDALTAVKTLRVRACVRASAWGGGQTRTRVLGLLHGLLHGLPTSDSERGHTAAHVAAIGQGIRMQCC